MSDDALHRNARNVRQALHDLGVDTTVVPLAESARTAREAAQALGIEVGAICSSLVFLADGDPVLVLTSGAHRVDTGKVAALLGATSVTRADADAVRAATGQPIGGVAPVGHPRPLTTLVDAWLDRYPTVWAAAGHPHVVFPTTYQALLAMTGGRPCDVGQD